MGLGCRVQPADSGDSLSKGGGGWSSFIISKGSQHPKHSQPNLNPKPGEPSRTCALKNSPNHPTSRRAFNCRMVLSFDGASSHSECICRLLIASNLPRLFPYNLVVTTPSIRRYHPKKLEVKRVPGKRPLCHVLRNPFLPSWSADHQAQSLAAAASDEGILERFRLGCSSLC